jgi:hypothetical protein
MPWGRLLSTYEEYQESEQQLHPWLQANPRDLRAWNYLAVATLYEEMFKRGVLESCVYRQGGDVFIPGKLAITPEFQQELLDTLDKAQQARMRHLPTDPQCRMRPRSPADRAGRRST